MNIKIIAKTESRKHFIQNMIKEHLWAVNIDIFAACSLSLFTLGSNWKLLKKKNLNALTCRPPLTLNAYICDSELYIAYNFRIAQLILSNKNVIWILMFSKKIVALNKIIAGHNCKFNDFVPFWDLTYKPEWFQFIDVGLEFLALKKCIAIRIAKNSLL